MPTFVVFSHLRWNFVYQRPQHLLSRIAQHCPVLFMEEAVHDDAEPHLERIAACPGVEVLRPHTNGNAGGYADSELPVLERLLKERLAESAEDAVYAWVYTPMALPLVEAIRPAKIVYDCMDELSQFKFAPPQLLERERMLMERADLVFCGGLSLYKAREDKHASVHCFPSSVDARHFAGRDGCPAGDDPQTRIARPRFGYCGVIDERIDLGLIREVACTRADWQFVLVGPVVKIDPASVPSAPNIHAFGMQAYAELPRFMAGWDAGIMPFALNDATRYISPTKTLEYLAAGLPVVSTPVADVVASYSGVVEIAADPATFVAACDRVLSEPDDAKAARQSAMRRAVAATSWDRTAEAMWALIRSTPAKAGRSTGASVEKLTPRHRGTRYAGDGSPPVAKTA